MDAWRRKPFVPMGSGTLAAAPGAGRLLSAPARARIATRPPKLTFATNSALEGTGFKLSVPPNLAAELVKRLIRERHSV